MAMIRSNWNFVYTSNEMESAQRFRQILLIIFLVTTYPIATVIGFGWLLCIMGFAQVDSPEQWRTKIGFLFVFFLMELYLVPWASIFNGAFSQ